MMNTSCRARRGGFTLIELLVILAIIAVLTALAAGAYFRVIGAQQAARTEDGIRKIEKNMRDQWNKVKTDADKEFDSLDPTSSLQAVYALANNDIERARVLWRILRITEAFPQSYDEINNAVNPPDLKTNNATIYGFSYQGPARPTSTYWYWIPPDRRNYLRTFAARINNPSAGQNQLATQSAACLYLTLTQTNRGGNLQLKEEHLPANIADSDLDGVKEFVDNFANKPLTFIRFPIWTSPPKPRINFVSPKTPKIDIAITAELATFNPNTGANAIFGDPLDPTGLLQQNVTVNGVTKKWYLAQYTPPALGGADASLFTPNMTNGDLLAQLCAHPFPHMGEYKGQTYAWPGPQPYYMPILISNGADGTYDTVDDVVSFRLKVGARGGD
jgi:prepilin-type N-terminal cleavage/methylation domain-containing protein